MNDTEEKIAEIMLREESYSAEAYDFVGRAVSFTISRLKAHRHVSAAELLAGIRDFARQEFGAVAGSVLEGWGIFTAADVGRVVYLMIDAGLLSASPEDSPHDFEIDFQLAALPDEPSIPEKLPKLDE